MIPHFRKWFESSFRAKRRPVCNRRRLNLEPLESRQLLSVVAAGGQGLLIVAGPGEPNDIVVTPGLLTHVADGGGGMTVAVPPVITPAVLEGLTVAAHTSVGIGAEVEIGFDIPILPVVFGDGVLAPPLFGEIAGGGAADLFSILQERLSSTVSEDGSSVVAGAKVPQDGNVFYEVAGKDSEFISEYQLYQAVVDPGAPVVYETEGNDGTSSADDINFFNSDGVSRIVKGQFDAPGDVDYYKFTALPGERLVVILDNNPERNGEESSQTVSSASSLNAPIPDNGQLPATLPVSLPKGRIADLKVKLNIEHTRLADLDIFLVAPGGQRLALVKDVGEPGESFVNTVLDDEATTDIADGTSTFTGSFRPEGPLSSFDGLDPNGTWTLEINDDQIGEIGKLNNWSLDFTIDNKDNDKAATYLALLDYLGTPVTGFGGGPDYFQHADNMSADEGNAVGAFDVVPISPLLPTAPVTHYVAVADTGIGADDTYRFVVLKLDPDNKVEEAETLDIASTEVPKSIPVVGSVESTLTVAPTTVGGTITDVNVTLDIDHTYDEDLRAFLKSPDGTQIQLFAHVGGSGDDFDGTILDDEAAAPITAASAPFAGTFQPQGSLAAFNGEDPHGTWTLRVTDVYVGDSGTLDDWSLAITTDVSNTMTGAAALAGDEFGDGQITPGDTDFFKATGADEGDLVFSYVDTHNASITTNFGFSIGSIDSTLALTANDETTPIASADNGGPPGTSNDNQENLNDVLDAAGVDFDALGTPMPGVIAVDLGEVAMSLFDPTSLMAAALTGELGRDTRDNSLDMYAIQAATQIIAGGMGTEEIKAGGGDVFIATFGGPDIVEVNIAFDSRNTWVAGAEPDELRVPANPTGDIIDIEFTGLSLLGPTFTVDVNGVIAEYTIPDSSLEQIIIDAGEGDDLLTVRGQIPEWMTEGIDFLGGPGRDSVVIFESDPGSLAIRRQDADLHFGSVSLGGRPSVNYENTETVTITPFNELSGETFDPGRVIVFNADPFEFNNSRLNATELSLLAGAHVLPNIDNHVSLDLDDIGDVDEPDEDWYHFRAPKIGTFSFDVLYERIAELPGGGELQAAVYREDGSLIVASTDFADGDVVSFSAAKDESYFLRVWGGDDDAINVYDVNLVEVDQVGPQVYDPDGAGPLQAIQITGEPTFDLFDPKASGGGAGGQGSQGPTPLVHSITLNLRDILNRLDHLPPDLSARAVPNGRAPGDLYPALDALVAAQPGHYEIRGDASGIIPIQQIIINNNPPIVDQIATATVQIVFFDPLPDDRYTLTIFDTLVDPPGNALDGNSNLAEPLEEPQLPTGDGVAGGDFVARFTVDSRPEIGLVAGGSVYVDTNGNWRFDPQNPDYTNHDIVYTLGYTSDDVFAGNFAREIGHTADGFDKLAAYGLVGDSYRWLVDTDNDGVPNVVANDPANVNGLPVAGRFDDLDSNGDEVGLFTGDTWYFDTDHDFQLDLELPSNLQGFPIVGDVDGDGFDDLGAWIHDRFTFDLTGGTRRGWDGVADAVIEFGFIGVRERPVAADMDGDGIDDIGLWVPDRTGAIPDEVGEWYFLISDDPEATRRIPGTVTTLAHPFTPIPFGRDLFAQCGDDFAVPLVGNFDPPLALADNAGPVQPLGPITFLQLAGLDPSAGDLRYTLETTRGGILTIEAVCQGTADGVELALFDPNASHTPLATSKLVGGNQRIDWQAGGPGEVYYLVVSGNSTDVDLRLANLLEQDGTGLTVYGTGGDDQFEFDASSSRVVTINGVGYEFDPAEVSSVAFDGAGGENTATLTGSPGEETVRIRPTTATFSGPGFEVTVENTAEITAHSGGGGDAVFLYDSPRADTLVAAPGEASLAGEGYSNRALGFPAVYAIARYGGFDTAELHDSAGTDRLVAKPTYSKLTGEGFLLYAKWFEQVSAYATPGESDLALLFGSTGNDLLIARPTEATLSGPGYSYSVTSFDAVTAIAVRSGSDVAYLYDSLGADKFVGRPEWSKLRGDGFNNTVKSFDTVHGIADAGGSDVAYLFGSSGDDTFVGKPNVAKLYGEGYKNRAVGFEAAYARGAAGNDKAYFFDSAFDDFLEADGNWAQLSSNSQELDFLYQVIAFESVRAKSTTGNDTKDVASEVDFLQLLGTWDE